jgi:hypothetical protein
MGEPFTLRRRTAAAGPLAQAGGPNRLPLAPGTRTRTTSEQKDLEVLGMHELADVPDNLPELLARAQEAHEAEFGKAVGQLEQEPSTFQMPNTLRLDQLPPVEQERLKGNIARMIELQRQEGAHAEQTAGLPVSLRQAAAAAAVGPGVAVFDSRKAAPVTGNASAPPPTPPPLAPTDPLAAPTPPAALAAPAFEPVDLDVAAWVAAQLCDGVFRKEFELFGGKMRVTYRTLTCEQQELVFAQLRDDTKAGRCVTIDDFWRLQRSYTTLLSLEQVVVGVAPTNVAKAVDEALAGDKAGGGKMPLPEVLEALTAKPPFQSASVWRVLCELVRRLELTVDQLEKMADRPDFSTAIGGRP